MAAGAAFGTINGYVYAIAFYHRISGLANPCANDVVISVVEAGKRVCPKNQNRKEPLTRSDKRLLFNHLTPGYSLVHQRLWVMCSLMFAGFLRFDEVSTIRLKDFTFKEGHLTIHLPRSKVDALRLGDRIHIASSASVTCPVLALNNYLIRVDVSSGCEFVFRRILHTKTGGRLASTNVPVSYNTVRRDFLRVVSQAGLDSSRVGLHSFRSGGATLAANEGVCD